MSKKQPKPGTGVKPGPGEVKVKVVSGSKRRFIILKESAIGYRKYHNHTERIEIPATAQGYELEVIDNPMGEGTAYSVEVPGHGKVTLNKDYLERTHREFEIRESGDSEIKASEPLHRWLLGATI